MKQVLLGLCALLACFAVDAIAGRSVPYRHVGGVLGAQESFSTGPIEAGSCANLSVVVGGIAYTANDTGNADSVKIEIQHSIDGDNWEPFTAGFAAADSLALRSFSAYRIVRVPLVTDAVGGAAVGWTGSAPNRYLQIVVTNLSDSASTNPDPDSLELSVGVFGPCN